MLWGCDCRDAPTGEACLLLSHVAAPGRRSRGCSGWALKKQSRASREAPAKASTAQPSLSNSHRSSRTAPPSIDSIVVSGAGLRVDDGLPAVSGAAILKSNPLVGCIQRYMWGENRKSNLLEQLSCKAKSSNMHEEFFNIHVQRTVVLFWPPKPVMDNGRPHGIPAQ